MNSRVKKDTREFTSLKTGYQLEVVRQKDILADINFSDEDDVDICKDIITQLETKAAQVLVQGGTVALPYIGRLRKPLVKEEYEKNRKLLKVASSVMSAQDLRDYKHDLYWECVAKVESEDNCKKLRRKLIAKNRKRYVEKYTLFGESGANLWIETLLWMKPIEFNQEVQDVFDEIEANETRNRKINNR